MLKGLNTKFGYWLEDQRQETSEPDAITIIFMSHFLGQRITLISGKGTDVWCTDDRGTDIILVYNGDNKYTPTEVGI